jgi:hypothetical protein
MNKECVYVGQSTLGGGGEYQIEEVALYFTPQASPGAAVAANTARNLCTSDGVPFIIPAGAMLTRIVAVPAPYTERGAHVPSASGAALTALNAAGIVLTRHAVTGTDPLQYGSGENIRVYSPEDAVAGNATVSTGWITESCVLPLGPVRLSTGQSLDVFYGAPDGKAGAQNPAGTETGFVAGAQLYAHKTSAQDSGTFIKSETLLRGRLTGAALESDVGVVVTYIMPLTTYNVVGYG